MHACVSQIGCDDASVAVQLPKLSLEALPRLRVARILCLCRLEPPVSQSSISVTFPLVYGWSRSFSALGRRRIELCRADAVPFSELTPITARLKRHRASRGTPGTRISAGRGSEICSPEQQLGSPSRCYFPLRSSLRLCAYDLQPAAVRVEAQERLLKPGPECLRFGPFRAVGTLHSSTSHGAPAPVCSVPLFQVLDPASCSHTNRFSC